MTATRTTTATPRLRLKLLTVMASVAAGVVLICFVAVYFPLAQIANLDASLRARAEGYGQMGAAQARSAVAFDDRETAREVFESLATDPSVVHAALYHESGRLIYAQGSGGRAPVGRVDALRVEERANRVRAVAPVVSAEGPRGVLVVEVSRAEAIALRGSARKTAGAVGLVALLIGLAAAWSAGTSVRLARDVQSRTEDLDARNADLRMVLENIGQGFLKLDRAGRIAAERSAAVDAWLGPVPDGAHFWDYLRAVDARAADWFHMGWEMLLEGAMPAELVADQLPKRLTRGDAHYALEYKPMGDGAPFSAGALVVISDVTAAVGRERAEARQRELARAFESITADRSGFVDFHAEADALVRVAAAGGGADHAARFRAWHTLKGNFAAEGFDGLAALCHEAECAMSDDPGASTADTGARLAARWDEFSTTVRALLGNRAEHRCEVDAADLAALAELAQSTAPRAEVAARILALTHEPVEARLARAGEHARTLARRLEKGDVRVDIQGNGVRLPRAAWGPFWAAFTHAVRNAVDHGFESPEERARAGKPAAPTLGLRAARVDGRVLVEITDDGRGVDWAAVASRARENGLPHATRADLVEALFASGLSTRSAVSEVSGRGVGMGALRAACESLGGSVEVESATGSGTAIRFWIPAAPAALQPGGFLLRAQPAAASA